MENKDEELCNKLLCHTCLSVDRNIFEITNENLKKYYDDVLEEVPLNKSKPFDNLMVCWECNAVLKKCWKFREQVKDSYRILQTYTKENFHECLNHSVGITPSLRVHNTEPVNIPAADGEDQWNTPVDHVKIESVNWEGIKDESSNLKEEDHIPDDGSPELEAELQSIISSIEKRDRKNSRSTKNKSKRSKKIVKTKEKESTDQENHNTFKSSPIVDDKRPMVYEVPLVDRKEITPVYEAKVNCNEDLECSEADIPSPECDDKALDNFDSKILDNSTHLDVEMNSRMSSIKNGCKKRSKSIKRDVRSKKIVKSLKQKKLKLGKEMKKIITVELTYEEMLSEREKESKRESYMKAEYKCQTCLIGFMQKKTYQTHLNTKHSEELGEYRCPICETIISSVDSFTAHYKRHMRRYECSICKKRTTDLKVMHQHYYSTHEISLKQYKCNICGKISTSIDTHRYHKDSHKARVECPDCDKTFRHRAGLMNHRLAVHEFQNAFPCNVCDKVFRWKNSLKRHLEKHDSKEKSNPTSPHCSLCRINFASICSYQRHLKNSLKHVTQDQLRYICDHCKRRFCDKTKLRDHIEEKHLHTTYHCHICSKPYKNRVGLDQHIRNVHKGRPKNKMCHHCGRGFPTNMQLESHIRTHTGERPFICEFCPTTFSQQSNLYKHYRQVHLNIKSKRYPMCKKRREDNEEICKVPMIQNNQVVEDNYRPIVLQYSPERPAEYIQYRNFVP